MSLGLIALNCSNARPAERRLDGRRFATSTSALAASSATMARPCAVFRSTATLFLLRLAARKYVEIPSTDGGVQERVSSPPAGFSIFQTSAPRSAKVMVHHGPASTRVTSSTLIPCSGAAIAIPSPKLG